MMKTLISALLLILAITAKAQNIPYTNTTEAGILVGVSNKSSFTIQTFNGVKIKKWQSEIGLTSAIDQYTNMTLVPLSLGFKWIPLSKKSVSPFIGLNAGYGFNWLEHSTTDHKYYGGHMLSSTIGLRIKTGNKASINFGLGYKQQEASVVETFPGFERFFSERKDEFTFRRTVINFGLSF